MRAQVVLVALALVLAPLGAKAADLVVWWEKGYYDAGGRGGPRRSSPPSSRRAASRSSSSSSSKMSFRARSWRRWRPAGRPISPSAFGCRIYRAMGVRRSAGGPLGRRRPFLGPVRSGCARPRGDCSTRRPGKRHCTRCRSVARSTTSTSGKACWSSAGFTLADIPREWEAFWSFWCDQVQPAVRRATGRDDIWGVGLPMSAERRRYLYRVLPVPGCPKADYVTPDGRARHRRSRDPATAHQGDRQLHGDLPKGCTPPDSVTWVD